MRDYGKVHSTFWSSGTTGGLTDDAKILALYLLTCSHSTIAGVFRLPDGYVSEDLGWDSARVRKGFAELFKKGFANRCETTKWVFIRRHFEWNKPENPNQWKSAVKIASQVPADCSWIAEFKAVFAVASGETPAAPANPSETLSKPETVTEAVSGTGAGTENSAAGADVIETQFEEVWAAYPARPGRSKAASLKAYKARLKAGDKHEKILEGVIAYATYCQRMCIGPQFIKQPETFLGPDKHFLSNWSAPPGKQTPAGGRHNDFSNRDYTAGVSADGTF